MAVSLESVEASTSRSVPNRDGPVGAARKSVTIHHADQVDTSSVSLESPAPGQLQINAAHLSILERFVVCRRAKADEAGLSPVQPQSGPGLSLKANESRANVRRGGHHNAHRPDQPAVRHSQLMLAARLLETEATLAICYV